MCNPDHNYVLTDYDKVWIEDLGREEYSADQRSRKENAESVNQKRSGTVVLQRGK